MTTEPIEQEVNAGAVDTAIEPTVKVDNPVFCELKNDERTYAGHVKFAPFTFAVWRKWRKTIRDKKSTAKLKELGYDTDEQEAVLSYWSGAAIIEEWAVTCEEDGDVQAVPQPMPGVPPADEMDFEFFMWFRRVANNYIVPRLGMFPK